MTFLIVGFAWALGLARFFSTRGIPRLGLQFNMFSKSIGISEEHHGEHTLGLLRQLWASYGVFFQSLGKEYLVINYYVAFIRPETEYSYRNIYF